MIFKKILLTTLVVFMAMGAWSQSQIDRQLAEQYFQQREYEKALIYYDDFYKNHPNPAYFQRMFTCLVELEQYDQAEKLIKKEVRRNPDNYMLGVEMGKMYARQGDRKSAEKAWDDVVKTIPAQQNNIISAAREFSSMGEYQYALEIYDKGKRELNNFYGFNFEIAEVYGLMGQDEKMIDMYLEMLQYNRGYMQTVQNLLARNIDFEDDDAAMDILRSRLLKFIQQEPDEKAYSELLIWLYIQQRDFYGALVQVKALDRRFNENGYRVIGMAEMAEGNEFYDVAAAAYEYVISKGKDNIYYTEASQAALRTRKIAFEKDAQSTLEDYQNLSNEYQSFMQEFGLNNETASSQREWAGVVARHLNETDSALSLLNKIIQIGSISPELKAECQIDAGDYLVMKDEVWDAALEYLKAEKAFKYDEIGERAKFKAAKVYYYTGEFGFAKGMLDVLKGSTSRLIANDALYLSQLITDNTTIDTSEVPMQIFAKADLLFNQLQYTRSLNLLDSLQVTFPSHRLDDDVWYMKYRIHMAQKQYGDAADDLQKIITLHAADILGDDAVYNLGILYEEYLDNVSEAMSLYEKILLDYPASLYVVDARKRYRTLRGDVLTQ